MCIIFPLKFFTQEKYDVSKYDLKSVKNLKSFLR